MEQVFVTGHRNPDTDSIVSAMSYAALQNALGQRGYTAARLGFICAAFSGFISPALIYSASASTTS